MCNFSWGSSSEIYDISAKMCELQLIRLMRDFRDLLFVYFSFLSFFRVTDRDVSGLLIYQKTVKVY